MDILLSAVAIPVRNSVLSEYSRLVCKCKESKEADAHTKQFCKFIMEQIDHAVHINLGSPKYLPNNDEIKRIYEELKAMVEERIK